MLLVTLRRVSNIPETSGTMKPHLCIPDVVNAMFKSIYSLGLIRYLIGTEEWIEQNIKNTKKWFSCPISFRCAYL